MYLFLNNIKLSNASRIDVIITHTQNPHSRSLFQLGLFEINIPVNIRMSRITIIFIELGSIIFIKIPSNRNKNEIKIENQTI